MTLFFLFTLSCVIWALLLMWLIPGLTTLTLVIAAIVIGVTLWFPALMAFYAMFKLNAKERTNDNK